MTNSSTQYTGRRDLKLLDWQHVSIVYFMFYLCSGASDSSWSIKLYLLTYMHTYAYIHTYMHTLLNHASIFKIISLFIVLLVWRPLFYLHYNRTHSISLCSGTGGGFDWDCSSWTSWCYWLTARSTLVAYYLTSTTLLISLIFCILSFLFVVMK